MRRWRTSVWVQSISTFALRPIEGEGSKLVLQRVPETKAVKNRLHLDLDYDSDTDIEAEADRLVGLGAVRVGRGQLSDSDGSWIVMADLKATNSASLCWLLAPAPRPRQFVVVNACVEHSFGLE